MIGPMLLLVLYASRRVLFDAILVRRAPEARLQSEVLALRQQLRVLERQVDRPRWQPADRFDPGQAQPILPRTTKKNDGRRTPTVAHLRTNLVAVHGNESLAIRLSFVALDLFASSGLVCPRPLRDF